MISFDNVSYSYSGSSKKILEGASFEISKGDFAVITGKTGAGKSTIIHLLTCEAKPESGEISVGPFELSTLKKKNIPHYRRSLGFVFQDFKLLEEKTAAENVSFALEIQRKDKSKDIANKTSEVLERVGLSSEAHLFPRVLSAGSRQRAAIARALVTEPLVLVADEVTGQLDESAAASIHAILVSENIRGMTILLTSVSDQFFSPLPKSSRRFELEAGKVNEISGARS